jgi:hypothetical protein
VITSYDKNKFIEKLTEAQTGIIKCLYSGNYCFRFNQKEFNEFIKIHSSKN